MLTRPIAILVFTFTISSAVKAQDRFELLKEQRVKAIERAVAPINDRYVNELEKLLKTTIASGDLDEAVRIREEIALFKKEQVPMPVSADTQGGGQDGVFERSLIGTTWTFDDPAQGPHRCDFERKGVLRLFRKDDRGRWVEYATTRKWEIINSEARTVKVSWFSSEQVVQISEDLKEITGGMKNWVVRSDDE